MNECSNFEAKNTLNFKLKHRKAQNVHFIREILYGRVGEIGAVSGRVDI